MAILRVDLININLHDVDFDEDDPETIIRVRLMSWHNRFKQRKVFKNEILSSSSCLLVFKIFVGPAFLVRTHCLLNFFKEIYLQPILTAVFFLEYCSTEIVIVSSIFFVTYELETF